MILGITSWTGLCRLLRAETLKIREIDYVQAAHAMGVKHRKTISRHIIPNVMHIILITVVLDFSSLVLAEAVLSYVGVGVDPTTMSWGNMINSARLELAREPIVWWQWQTDRVYKWRFDEKKGNIKLYQTYVKLFTASNFSKGIAYASYTQMMNGLFPYMNPEDHLFFLEDVRDAAPDKFDAVYSGIRHVLDEKVVEEVALRVPEVD